MNPSNHSLRHEIVLLFDVKDGNPNGDPDAGNLPRVDPETMHGLITDVALKRKIRDYIDLTRKDKLSFSIFVQSKVALNTLIIEGFREAGVNPLNTELTEEEQEHETLLVYLDSLSDMGFTLDGAKLIYSGEAIKKKDIEKALLAKNPEEEKDLRKQLSHIAQRLADSTKGTKIGDNEREKAQKWLLQRYFDIRMFGAVLSTGLNAGQVRGPIQLTFARSIDPIAPLEASITRVAITKEVDRQRKRTEMGRKPLVPYGLYRAHAFFNPFLAKQTGVTQADLEALLDALANLFDFDRSAARGEMAVRGLAVFTHENEKGNAPAHRLFELISVQRREGMEVPRSFDHYQLVGPESGDLKPYGFPGVTLTWLVRPRSLEVLEPNGG